MKIDKLLLVKPTQKKINVIDKLVMANLSILNTLKTMNIDCYLTGLMGLGFSNISQTRSTRC